MTVRRRVGRAGSPLHAGGIAKIGAHGVTRPTYVPTRCALDFVQRRRVFQGRCIAEFFAEIRGANDAAHDFCVSRFWYVADENDFLGRERFAKLGGERVF